MSDQYRKTGGREGGDGGRTEVYRSDIYELVIACEAIPLTTHRGRVATWFNSCIAQGIER